MNDSPQLHQFWWIYMNSKLQPCYSHILNMEGYTGLANVVEMFRLCFSSIMKKLMSCMTEYFLSQYKVLWWHHFDFASGPDLQKSNIVGNILVNYGSILPSQEVFQFFCSTFSSFCNIPKFLHSYISYIFLKKFLHKHH